MLCKRIIPCLDVDGGRTVKGIKFQELRDVGDPVELASAYQDQGADELVFLDISATIEGRRTMLEVVSAVAYELMIPFTVGGGIRSMDEVKALLSAGADKVSVNTAAVKGPEIVDAISGDCGSQCCVVAVDARRKAGGTGWEVLINGGRTPTERDALEWGHEVVERGAGEILLTSWDQDGTLQGYDLELTRAFSDSLPIPIIASGGGGTPSSFVDVFNKGCADAALAATIFHDGTWTVDALKKELSSAGVEVRL